MHIQRRLGPRRARRIPRGRAALLLGAIGLLQVGIGATLVAGSGSAVPDLTLTSDADGAALFAAAGLAPAHPVTRCLRLSYSNAVAGDQLKLMSSSSGALADHVQVRVEAGTGGSAASCTGFTGSVVYSGTLDALSAAHGTGTTALPLKTLPDGSAVLSVRIRIGVDDTNLAQGTSASSDLVWVADSLGDRTPPPPVFTPIDPDPPVTQPIAPPAPTTPAVPPIDPATTTPADPVTDNPLPSTPSGSDSNGSDSNSSDSNGSDSNGSGTEPVVPSAAPSPPVASEAPTSPALTPGSGSDQGTGGIAEVGQVLSSGVKVLSSGAKAVASAAGSLAHAVGTQVIAPVAQAAAPAVRGAGFGLGGTAPLLGAFLLIQGRIDRRDPKLALAPAYADPDLTFNDIPRGPLKPRDTTPPTAPEPGGES